MARNALRGKGLWKRILLTIGFILLIGYCSSLPPTTLNGLTQDTILTPGMQTKTPTGETELPTLSSPIWTPLPTFPPDQREKKVMELYENPICRLPCWWGIVPGKTDWRETWQFLSRFATNLSPREVHFYESERLPDYRSYQFFLDVPKVPEQEFYPILNQLVFYMRKDSTVIQYIRVNTGNIKPYTIPQILAVYGRPQQVYVRATEHQRPESNSVRVYLFYPEQGIMSVHFTTVDLEAWKNNEITACFQKYTDLLLWREGDSLDTKFIWALNLTDYLDSNGDPYQPLEKVSDLDSEAFYEMFVGSSQEVCVKIFTANLER